LGERLHGMQKVIGSSPLSSTPKGRLRMTQVAFFFGLRPPFATFETSKNRKRVDHTLMTCFAVMKAEQQSLGS
jgi:hypothetical protein